MSQKQQHLDGFELAPAEKYTHDVGQEFMPINIYCKNSVLVLEFTEIDRVPVTQFLLYDLESKLRTICGIHTITEICVFARWDETSRDGFDHTTDWLSCIYDTAEKLDALGSDQRMRVYVSTESTLALDNSKYHTRTLPYFLITSWLTYYNSDFCWNANAQKALFLSGKFHKISRLLMLKKIRESEKYSNIIDATLVVTDNRLENCDADSIDSIMRLYDPKWPGITEWVYQHSYMLDEDHIEDEISFNYIRLPINDLANRLMLIVVESWPSNLNFITEKTYNPICLGMPFVLHNNNFADRIENMGFLSYQNMLKLDTSKDVPKKNTPEYQEYLCDCTLDHTEQFLQRARTDNLFVSQVRNAIEHNKQRAAQIVRSYREEYNRYLGVVFNHIFTEKPPVEFD